MSRRLVVVLMVMSGCCAAQTAATLLPAGTNTYTANHTITAAENGYLIIMNCSSACTLTLNGSPTKSTYGSIETIGSSNATVSLNSLNYNGSSSVPALIQFEPMQFNSDGSNYFGPAPLVAGSNITLTPASNGVTIAASGGGSSLWSGLGNPGANLSLSMGAFTSTFTAGAATGSTDVFDFTDTTGNTGTGKIVRVFTQSGSAATPFQADINGNGVQLNPSGVFQAIGAAGHNNADQANGGTWPASAGLLGTNSSRQPISVSALPNPTTTATQGTTDNSTDVATDQFAQNVAATLTPIGGQSPNACGTSNTAAPCYIGISPGHTATFAAATIDTPASAGQFWFCGSLWLTAVGTGAGGTWQLQLTYTNPSGVAATKTIGANVSNLTVGADNAANGAATGSCINFEAGAGAAIQVGVITGGTISTPGTWGYSGSLMQLSK
jgi:hypothetical protein